MASQKLCPNCSGPLQPGFEGNMPIAAGFREMKFPVLISECPQCHLLQMYAETRSL